MGVVVEKPSTMHMHFNAEDPPSRKFHLWLKCAGVKDFLSEESDNPSCIKLRALRNENEEVGRKRK